MIICNITNTDMIMKEVELDCLVLAYLLKRYVCFFEDYSHLLQFIFMFKQETSILKGKLLTHENLVRSAESFKLNYIEAGPSSSPQSWGPSSANPQSRQDSTASAGRGSSTWSKFVKAFTSC